MTSSITATRSTGCAGRVCLITGATSGIGRAAAFALAGHASCLLLVGRNANAGRQVGALLQRKYPRLDVRFLRGDISSLAGVRQLAKAVQSETTQLDVLINNAGARFDAFSQTPEGIEATFATNHLGHFLLTAWLTDQLLRSNAARIINVSSSAHAAATRPASWLLTAANYDRRQAYARSKLANVLFTYELSRRLAGCAVTSNAVHPGMVFSGFARNNGWVSWLKHLVSHGLRRELISTKHGADIIAYLATSPEVTGVTGKYFFKRRAISSSPLSHDESLAQELWSASVRLCGLDSSLGPAWKYFAP